MVARNKFVIYSSLLLRSKCAISKFTLFNLQCKIFKIFLLQRFFFKAYVLFYTASSHSMPSLEWSSGGSSYIWLLVIYPIRPFILSHSAHMISPVFKVIHHNPTYFSITKSLILRFTSTKSSTSLMLLSVFAFTNFLD